MKKAEQAKAAAKELKTAIDDYDRAKAEHDVALSRLNRCAAARDRALQALADLAAKGPDTEDRS